MSKGRKWDAASKFARCRHQKRYPHCRVPGHEADVLAREREVHPEVRLENRRQKERERIREKRRQAKADSNQVSAAILAKAGKHQKRNQKCNTFAVKVIPPGGL